MIGAVTLVLAIVAVAGKTSGAPDGDLVKTVALALIGLIAIGYVRWRFRQ